METEFGFINRLKKNFDLPKIGDDAAVLPKNEETDLVITADLLIEDIDFRRDWAEPVQIGHKALAVSLSDIAAMGARPVWAMLSLGIPESVWKTKFIDEFYRGWFDLANRYEVELIGGDISRSPDRIVIDSIVGGEVEKNRAVRRSTANPGDLIWVTGQLGGAAAGLSLLAQGKRLSDAEGPEKALIGRQLEPCPRIPAARKLNRDDLISAMIDISDGLTADLYHICRESGVGAVITAEKIPVDENLIQINPDPAETFELALGGGEDFELLFSGRRELPQALLRDFPIAVTLIGRIDDEAGKIKLIKNEKLQSLQPKGFRHF